MGVAKEAACELGVEIDPKLVTQIEGTDERLIWDIPMEKNC